MKVKEYDQSDYDELKILINAYHVEVEEVPESLESFYNQKNLGEEFTTLIVEEKGLIVGFIIGESLTKNDFLLLDLYVKEEYRGKGIALKLVKELIKKAKNYKRVLANPIKKESKNLLVKKFDFKELPSNEQHTPKKGKPPYYTHYLIK